MGGCSACARAPTFGDPMRAVRNGLAQELAGDAPQAFLLYIDQGEELYASTEREGKPDAAAKRDAATFSRVIAEAAGRADCRVILSLRSDYYGSLQEDDALFATTLRVDIPPMAGGRTAPSHRAPGCRTGAFASSPPKCRVISPALPRARRSFAASRLSSFRHVA